ncbi:MAG: ABC transporter ATP-binding protein/permease [Turicibacter sp.]|nr:ABC transporter ATP-binding protein/permease [Turicibacter sp.]
MKKHLFAHPVLLGLTILLGILTQGISMATSFALMHIVDTLTYGEADDLFGLIYLSLIFIIIFFVTMWAYSKMSVYSSFKTQLSLKTTVFDSIMNLSIDEFGNENSAKFISVLNNDIKLINDNYIQNILEVIKFVISGVLAFVSIAILSPINAIIALILSSFPLIMPFLLGGKLAETNILHMEKLGKLNERIKDYLMGFEVIKTFAIEARIKKIFDSSAYEAEQARYAAGKVSVQLGAITGTMIVATQFFTYLVAGYFVLQGTITIGAVIAIVGLTNSIAQPIQFITHNIAGIKSTKKVRENFISLTEYRQEENGTEFAVFNQGISLRNVSFTYSNETKKDSRTQMTKKPKVHVIPYTGEFTLEAIAAKTNLDLNPEECVLINSDKTLDDIQNIIGEFSIDQKNEKLALKNINYDFKNQGKYAIVGTSGSGKSTLAKLLLGYYKNYDGNIQVGGTEIKNIKPDFLYANLAPIPQNVFILDDTVKNNITLYNGYSEEDYQNALKEAHLSEVIHALPAGSDTQLGEGGSYLSGGERQRIAIARAFIKKSKAIIMDEGTSSLDNKTSYLVEKALLEGKNNLSIFVTHRYQKETLAKCDGILVLKDGELVESGTFEELIQKKGYFYSLYTINVGDERNV